MENEKINSIRSNNKTGNFNMRKANYYFLIAGFLAILFAVTHEIHGQRITIPSLYIGAVEMNTITTLKFVWHIITAENFIFGIAFIIMAFKKEIKNVRFTAWLICTILVIRLFVIAGTTLTISSGHLSDVIIDIIAISIYIVIIILGMRKVKQ